MPELINIQTFEKIEGSNFRPTLNRFSNVLKIIGLWNEEIERAFYNFEWIIEDNGFVYSSTTSLGYLTSKQSVVRIRPLVLGYTPAIDQTFKDNWISCELLIESADLLSPVDGSFQSDTFDLVKSLTFEMQREFKQTGIYFTDEAQDGSDFDGIRNNDAEQIWQFDYALIPLTLEKLYSIKPETHNIKHHKDYFEAWCVDRWQENLNR